MAFYKYYLNRIQILRVISLLIFAFLSFLTCIKFGHFVNTITSENQYPRPAGVDAWLPISSLMNIRYFFYTKEVHPYHPAGFFFLITAIFVSFLFSKAFCAWVCPFGFLSEILVNLRKLILKKELKIPGILDHFLRSLKYFILSFFIYVIFKMDFHSLKNFLDSDYNKVADIKMYYFFAEISAFSLEVIIALLVLSFLFNFFWCRYLCPYGALMALFGLLSPFKIKRDIKRCTSCSKCASACPQYIKTDKVKTVVSDACNFCLMCVSNSSSKDNALNVNLIFSRLKLNLIFVPLLIIFLFVFTKFIAIKMGLWENNITNREYKELILKIDGLSHP